MIAKQSSSEFRVISPHHLFPSFRFFLQDVKHLIVRKADEGDASTSPSGKLARHALLVGAELRTHCIKQRNRTVDDVSHLFRAVVTLGLNHKADSAVQAHL